MNLPFPREGLIVGHLAVGQRLSIEASTLNHAAELVERERVGVAVPLQFQLGGADHLLHQPQRPADMHDFQHEALFECQRTIFLVVVRAPCVAQILSCKALELR